MDETQEKQKEKVQKDVKEEKVKDVKKQKTKKQTIKEKIIEIMKENGEMTLKKLYDKIDNRKNSVVRSVIYVSIKTNEKIFVKTGKGKYTLIENNKETIV